MQKVRIYLFDSEVVRVRERYFVRSLRLKQKHTEPCLNRPSHFLQKRDKNAFGSCAGGGILPKYNSPKSKVIEDSNRNDKKAVVFSAMFFRMTSLHPFLPPN